MDFTSQQLGAAIHKLEKLEGGLLRDQEKGLGVALLHLKAAIQEGMNSKRKVPGAKRKIQKRSGLMSASINTRTRRSGNTAKGYIGSTSIQGRLLEKGGTVRPTNRKWLTIPAKDGPVLTASGVPRGTARSFNLVFVQKKNEPTKAYLIGADDDLLYYVLRKTVKIPAHDWLAGPVRKARKKVRDRLEEVAKKSIKKAKL